jgi:hypothetical protein
MAGRQSICEPPEALANSAHTRRKRRHRWRTFPQPALTFPQRVTVQPDQLSAGGRAQGRARPSAPTAAPTGLIAAAATADVAAEPLSSPQGARSDHLVPADASAARPRTAATPSPAAGRRRPPPRQSYLARMAPAIRRRRRPSTAYHEGSTGELSRACTRMRVRPGRPRCFLSCVAIGFQS